LDLHEREIELRAGILRIGFRLSPGKGKKESLGKGKWKCKKGGTRANCSVPGLPEGELQKKPIPGPVPRTYDPGKKETRGFRPGQMRKKRAQKWDINQS